MEFLKKFYDKLLLAIALLVLLASGVILALEVNTLSALVEAPAPPTQPSGHGVTALNTGVFTNALHEAQQPPLWKESPLDPFFTVAIAVETPKTNEPVVVSKVLPVAFLRAVRKPFKFEFMEYLGEGRNFQINLIDGSGKTFFVPAVGDEIADSYAKRPDFQHTGYFVKKFDRIVTNVLTDTGPRNLDTSRLTVQHDADQPVVLVKGQITYEPELFAIVQCRGEDIEREVRRGQAIVCGGKTYNVVDIAPTQMVIVEPLSKLSTTILVGPFREERAWKEEHPTQ